MVKTKSGATAIQVGYYRGKLFKLKKHIGSAKELERIVELKNIAYEYIRTHSPQLRLNFNPQSEEILYKRGIKVKTAYLREAYDYLSAVYERIGFCKVDNNYLKHFSLMRVLEPASKIKSIELLNKYFGITYRKTTAFRELLKLQSMKAQTINTAVTYAKKNLGFDFSLVFYDVTTLYFEAKKDDEFRLSGFSKDNKINQPQILVGLLVEKIGFPIYFNLFAGNTFEGKTLIPFILEIKNKLGIGQFTIVADAGMLSKENLEKLETNNLNYIVASRVKTLSLIEAKNIALKLKRKNSKTLRVDNIIYEYSAKRAVKDKVDNDKQIEKASYYLANPGKVFKRSKFIKSSTSSFRLNEEAIEKYRILEGIKGYRTNIKNLKDKLLIERYKDLWRVEQSFRITKSDLEARPIFHRKKLAIEYHILIVFVALCMIKVIEMEKKQSIKKVTDELKDRWTITLKDEISGNTLEIELNKKPH